MKKRINQKAVTIMNNNWFFRIMVAIYAFINTVLCGLVMLIPFGDKEIMSIILDYCDITFYRSNRYDVVLFIFGLVFFGINIAILVSGLKFRKTDRYFCAVNDSGIIKISSNSVENIALSLSKRFAGVKDAKAKAKFTKNGVEIVVKLSVFPDVHVPNLCKSVQERIKESVIATMDLNVTSVDVCVDSVHSSIKQEES